MKADNNTLPKPRKVRGTGVYYGDDGFTFTPYEQGEPAQHNVKTCKGGKLYDTSSEKAPLKVAYLTCPASSPDLWSEFTSQLERLGIKPPTPLKQPTRQRLLAEGGLELYLDPKQQRLVYQGTIDLSLSRNWQSELMRQLQLIVRSLPAEEKFKKLINRIKKGEQQHV